jgi:MOSC domain-containing protein YiiM
MTEPTHGRVEAIFTSPSAGAPPVRQPRVVATPGAGLEGDRYALRAGHWSPHPGAGRDLTLIEAEVIQALREECGLAFEAGALRRNVITRGVRLNDLVGLRFRIGSVLVQGARLCEPCEYLVQMVGAPILEPLVHRGGLRVDILTGGELVEGDRISLDVLAETLG